jgi:hypothetical protein
VPITCAFPRADDASLDGDLIVRDNLGHPVAIAAAELDAIETYIDPVLRDLLVHARTQREDDG